MSSDTATGRGIPFILLGTLMLTTQDAISKWLTADYHFGEIFFYRGIWAYLPIAYFVWRDGGLHTLRSARPFANIARAACNTASGVLIITSLSLMPMADVLAVAFMSPLILAALAPTFLGEMVGWRRWLAILVGFAGVLCMTRPGGGTLNLLIVMPLVVAFLMAARDVLTRQLGARDSTGTLLLYTVTITTGVGAVSLLFGTTMPPAGDWLLFIVAGFINGTAHYFVVKAFQLSPAPIVAPLRYFSLVWAVVIGITIWGDIPDLWMIAGTILVVGSGLYTMFRETR
jgi:drug/metabolite transporter (DMT)-like permease